MGGLDYTRAGAHSVRDAKQLALWTFVIQEREVGFWGRYCDAESTAKRYAQQYGLDSSTITLVDCTGRITRGCQKH